MSRARILVVDDEPDICELLEVTLRRMELDARTAGDLGQARQLLRTHPFDLCLTDMRLPDGNGIELYVDASDVWRREPQRVAQLKPLEL